MSRAWMLVLLAACSGAGASETEARTEDDLAERRYVDAYADAPMTGVARTKMLGALDRLAKVARSSKSELRRAIATETLARIEDGDVLLGSIQAARGIDRWHMCKDEELPVCAGAPPASDDRVWTGDAELARRLEEGLAGYQWGNRVYFSITEETDVGELAATLVHEAVHVAHRSECHYYAVVDDHVVAPEPAYVEEYRSFLAECWYGDDAATAEECVAYAKAATDDYGFGVSPDAAALGARLIGELVPAKATWPRAFGACE
ncbi:MAG: hypothetical protein KF837_33335 [Labilithrix sp.]|nr:hypothetical protein [Labilithrix sp.]